MKYTGHPIIVAAATAGDHAKQLAEATGGGVADLLDAGTPLQAACDASADPGDERYGRDVLMTTGVFVTPTVPHPSGNGWMTGLTVASGTRLGGMGSGKTVLRLAPNSKGGPTDPGTGTDLNPQGNNAYVITNRHPGGGTSIDRGILLADFTIDGDTVNQTFHHHGVVFWCTDGTVCDGIRVIGMRGTAGTGQGETFAFDVKAGANADYVKCVTEGAASGSTASGFSSNQGSFIRYDGCTADGLGVMGFTAYQAQTVTYTNCQARGNQTHGFNLEGSNDVTYTACVAGGSASARATGSPYVAGQSLGNKGYGFNIAPAAGVGSNDVTLAGCRASRNDRGANVNASSDVRIVGGSYRRNNKGICLNGPGSSTSTQLAGPVVKGNTVCDIEVGGYPKVGGGVGYTVRLGGVNPAPLIPPSGTPVPSPFPFDSTVFLTGDVTAFTLTDRNGVSTNLGSGTNRTFVVPFGATVTPTYTAPFTWQWLAP